MAYKKRTSPVRKTSAHKRRALRRRIVLYTILASCAAIAAGFVYLCNLPQLRIDAMQVVGARTLNPQEIQEKVSSLIDPVTLGMFPQDSIFWYPHDLIEQTLVDTYPEIRSIDVSLEDLDVLIITIEERTSEYYVQTADGIYGVDHDGVVFHHSNTDVSATSSRIFSSYAYDEAPVLLGSTFQGVYSFAEFNKFLDELESMGLAIHRIRFENSILTILEMSSGTRIVIYPENNHTSVISTMREIMGYKEFGYDRRVHAFGEPIEYINLRYGSKIFYCYTQDECANEYTIPSYEE